MRHTNARVAKVRRRSCSELPASRNGSTSDTELVEPLTKQEMGDLQHRDQQHARKNHSYLWVFQKPLRTERRRQ